MCGGEAPSFRRQESESPPALGAPSFWGKFRFGIAERRMPCTARSEGMWGTPPSESLGLLPSGRQRLQLGAAARGGVGGRVGCPVGGRGCAAVARCPGVAVGPLLASRGAFSLFPSGVLRVGLARCEGSPGQFSRAFFFGFFFCLFVCFGLFYFLRTASRPLPKYL